MTTIETMYAGKEIRVTGNTEKEASKALAKAKKALRKEDDARQKAREVAYTRARESVCMIAEKIQRILDGNYSNWYFTIKTPVGSPAYGSYRYEFGNRYGYVKYDFLSCVVGADLTKITVLDAVDGNAAMHDPITNKWYAIGICDGEIAFVDVPNFIEAQMAILNPSN